MKTSVVEVHDLLAVFSVDEVEKRIGEVPGVESVTVNFAAGNATVRFDETRLQMGDIKSIVRQRGFEPEASEHASMGDDPKDLQAPDTPTPAAAPNAAHGGATGDTAQQGQAAPHAAMSMPAASAPTPSPDANVATSPPADDEEKNKSEPDKS